MARNRRPLGPGGTWKTGQRVPVTGVYTDQYGSAARYEQHGTFVTCPGDRHETAYWRLTIGTPTAA